MQEQTWKAEEIKLKEILSELRNNIDNLEKKKVIIDAETEDYYEQYRTGNTEAYDSLIVSQDIQKRLVESLKNNTTSLSQPYFGRIDYLDKDDKKDYSIYIGKHGITKDTTNILIVDWRAPISTIYYDCNLGDDSYAVEKYSVPIRLDLKRTLDIEAGKLQGFYDSAAVTDDALLIKYLSKNKDAVLGDIITTIQKEQNAIIRESPYCNLIVQGVAGSGKTTVAVHRISYLLYNYAEKYDSSEFCILGSSHILLDYITSGLPDLDVHDTRQMQMLEFLQSIVSEEMSLKGYHITSDTDEQTRCKAALSFYQALHAFLEAQEKQYLPDGAVADAKGVYMSAFHLQEFLELCAQTPLQEKLKLLDERLQKRIPLVLRDLKKPEINAQKKVYRKFFTANFKKTPILYLYLDFLDTFDRDGVLGNRVSDKQLDLYDLAALALIQQRFYGVDESDLILQVIIDEAQDFGISLYAMLKDILHKAKFTLMGDVSQNIHYETGLNDWSELTEKIFSDNKSHFYTLCKSYRNTIEISNYAGSILEKADFAKYPIEPIIRHGKPVEIEKVSCDEDTRKRVLEIEKHAAEEGFETAAIICADEEEALRIEKILAPHMKIITALEEGFQFQSGFQIIPIDLVKGLEFDLVLLWDGSEKQYPASNAQAKRLYVAATRALHELYIFHQDDLAELLR